MASEVNAIGRVSKILGMLTALGHDADSDEALDPAAVVALREACDSAERPLMAWEDTHRARLRADSGRP